MPKPDPAPTQVVLAVDDEPRVLNGLRRLLVERVELVTASSGREALEILERDSIAVIMSDLRMPEMDGLELLSRSARQAPDTVRILLTGHGDYRVAMRALNDARAFAFLTKPCDPRHLFETIEEALEHHRDLMAASSARHRADKLEASLRSIARSLEEIGVASSDEALDNEAMAELQQLSSREWEVLRLLLQGHRVPGVARTLCISPHTVRSHLKSMFSKLEVGSQDELIGRVRGLRKNKN